MKKFILILFPFLFTMSVLLSASLEIYKYNTSTKKYHKVECRWAKKCTTNCIELTLSEIRDRGGVPCKVCKPPK
ncbi:MAG: hypothetical protein HYS25_13620 [Ignavibacteriales bacterium]|nr:hypothetical protein [Ignavibacteriales bacterium]